ncbi:MAG: Stp1/IreP family PP2C-type Ser/Thr phosphatase [Nitrospiria bacterium]
MRLITAGISDIGCVRRTNEDSIGLFHELNLFIVADGMGGHAAGEIASKMAVDQIKAYFKAPPQVDHLKKTENSVPNADRHQPGLAEAIAHANRQIFVASMENRALNGMGTTVVALLAKPDVAEIGFVGDSRVYLYRNKVLTQLTHDHSLVNEYVKRGILAPEEASSHPQKHVLSRALGTGSKVEVECLQKGPEAGDVFLLCSDGLSNKLSMLEMTSILESSGEGLEKASEHMVRLAKEKGGEDNISIVFVAYRP